MRMVEVAETPGVALPEDEPGTAYSSSSQLLLAKKGFTAPIQSLDLAHLPGLELTYHSRTPRQHHSFQQ